jgi:hypothetical protein|tara:strand:+ start:396 stop:671 length:276 start_codon:yes stop_codon:yes gene_type:complete
MEFKMTLKKNKFVCGDLVTLSANGNTHANEAVCGLIGVIMNIRPEYNDYPYEINWIGAEIISVLPSGKTTSMLPMKEWEIKFAKNGVHEKH